MKRSFACFLTLALALACCLVITFPANAETEGLYTYTVSNGKATITACDTSASDAVTIPATLGGYPVVALGKSAFQTCGKITSVVIPEGVQTIGDSAFYYCGMSAVTIPNTVTSIGSSAFGWCVNLTSIQIPAGVQTIGNSVFYGCGKLEKINVAAENTAFSSDAAGVLFNKDKTTLLQAPLLISGSYTVPEGVQTVNAYAFNDCDGLTAVTIADSVQTIGANAFYYCDGLTKVVVGNGVKTIGEFCFTGCKNLTSAKLGNSLEKLEMGAFSLCTSLTDVVLPDSITAIKWAAFSECPALKTYGNARYLGTASNPYYALVESVGQLIPSCRVHADTVMIANGAFRYVNLTALELGTNVKSIDKEAFVGCSYMKDVYYTGTEAQFGQIAIGDYNYDLTRATIHYTTSMPVQKGDVNEDDAVDTDDAIYLLQHVLMAELFPVNQDVDFDKNGTVGVDDAIYLLQHVLMPELFPI